MAKSKKKVNIKADKSSNKKEIIVAVSGGFDPLHIGHVRLLKEASKLGDKLIVIVNNDNWLRKKKGNEFMNENDRREILEAFNFVHSVYITEHKKDMNYNDLYEKSVCDALSYIKPHIFANGGDRFAENIPEFKICQELGIKMYFNVGHGGKIRSSSALVNGYFEKNTKKT